MACSLAWGRGTTGIIAILDGTAEAITVVVTMAADFMDAAGTMMVSEAADLSTKALDVEASMVVANFTVAVNSMEVVKASTAAEGFMAVAMVAGK